MNLYLDGRLNPTNKRMVTFTGLPTILKVEGAKISEGGWAGAIIAVGVGAEDIRNDYYIRINNTVIYGTNDVKEAKGNYFFYPDSTLQTGMEYQVTSAMSIARALNTTSLAVDYNIYVTVNEQQKNIVKIEAKEKGTRYSIDTIKTNTNWLQLAYTHGIDQDELDNCDIVADVYVETDDYKMDKMVDLDITSLPHLATLRKKFYKDNVKFDLSPILGNATDLGKVSQYDIIVNYTTNSGATNEIGRIMHVYAANGYQANDGEDYLYDLQSKVLAQNVSKGNAVQGVTNKTTLFYTDHIYFSLYDPNPDTTQPSKVLVHYKNSIGQMEASEEIAYSHINNSPLIHLDFTPQTGHYYTELMLPNQTIRYTNLVPTNYDEESDNITICFYNSYGGVSFFPFTKKLENNFEGDRKTYKKSNLDYYSTDNKASDKVYSISNKYEVTVQSHYMNNAGIPTLRDLQNSSEAWINDGNLRKEIIIEEVNVEEQDTNDVYLATVKFRYSLPDKF